MQHQSPKQLASCQSRLRKPTPLVDLSRPLSALLSRLRAHQVTSQMAKNSRMHCLYEHLSCREYLLGPSTMAYRNIVPLSVCSRPRGLMMTRPMAGQMVCAHMQGRKPMGSTGGTLSGSTGMRKRLCMRQSVLLAPAASPAAEAAASAKGFTQVQTAHSFIQKLYMCSIVQVLKESIVLCSPKLACD